MTFCMTRKPAANFRADRLAKRLHDELGQQLLGVTLATNALVHKLDSRSAPEAAEAHQIADDLRDASREVGRLISWLDHGNPR